MIFSSTEVALKVLKLSHQQRVFHVHEDQFEVMSYQCNQYPVHTCTDKLGI